MLKVWISRKIEESVKGWHREADESLIEKRPVSRREASCTDSRLHIQWVNSRGDSQAIEVGDRLHDCMAVPKNDKRHLPLRIMEETL